MPIKSKMSTVWRENRRKRGAQQDPHKRKKADLMRWYRAKKSSFKKANDIYIDGLDTGCDRRVYVLVMTTKLSQVHYATYDSHPENDWIPDVETVTSHWPKPEVWTPSNFSDDKPEKNAVKPNSIHRPRPRRKMKVSKAPILNL